MFMNMFPLLFVCLLVCYSVMRTFIKLGNKYKMACANVSVYIFVTVLWNWKSNVCLCYCYSTCCEWWHLRGLTRF